MSDLAITASGGSSCEYKTGSWREGQRPQFNSKKCRQCFLCFHHCPENCFLVKDGVIQGIDYTFCKGCGICSEVCPFKAIEMVEED